MSDGLGLFVLIRPNGSKAWQFRYRYMGKEKLLSIGTYPIVSLADARKKRDEAKVLLSDGIDPSTQKQINRINAETKARITFKAVADEYYQNVNGGVKTCHWGGAKAGQFGVRALERVALK